jgi:predicted RNA binding protein YcfA (HicA-like mRNA interferase family)
MPELRKLDGLQLTPDSDLTGIELEISRSHQGAGANGWRFDRMGKGDHMIFRHATRTGPVVVAGGGKLNRDVPTGTQNAILRQAGLK